MEYNEIIKRILKIKNLAEKGCEKEKETAKKILDELIKKYNIKIEEIEEEKRELYVVNTGGGIKKRLFLQVYKARYGKHRDIWETSKVKKKDLKLLDDNGYGDKNPDIIIECTKTEFLEIKTVFELYKQDLKIQMETFFYAYCYKNNLLLRRENEDDGEESEEYIEMARKAMEMSTWIEKKEIRKMLK